MYQPDTILTLKVPRDPDPETGEAFPYNKVRVVGPSPINHGIRSAEWAGSNGQGVLVVPITNFGSTLDEPYGKLTALYDVDSVPVLEVEIQPTVRVIASNSQSAGPTPEEVFAVKAPGVAPEEGSRRTRTPLVDPRPTPSTAGPLGEVVPEPEAAAPDLSPLAEPTTTRRRRNSA